MGVRPWMTHAERINMDKIAVCGIFKDEAPYLLEWLAFHKMMGIDLFVLYDNGSTDGGADLIRRSTFGRNVTLIDWPHAAGQIPAYQDFCTNHAARFGWVAFIDLDEFIVPIGCNSIREALMRRRYCGYSAISAAMAGVWPVRPTATAQRAGCRELHSTAASRIFPPARHVKSLVRGKAVTTAGSTPHIVNVNGPYLQHARRKPFCHTPSSRSSAMT